MARPWISQAKILMQDRDARRVILQSHFKCSFQAVNHQEKSRNPTKGGKMDDSSWWLPHPRTGIYIPKGHEWVMDDVPDNAASFTRTFWLRNVDDDEKPCP